MTPRTAFLILVIGLAAASCPNQCSGHGYCDESEKCVCFKAPGTALSQIAYVGADCSQRVCPYGRSHDLVRTAFILRGPRARARACAAPNKTLLRCCPAPHRAHAPSLSPAPPHSLPTF